MASRARPLRAAVFDIGGVMFMEHTRGGFLTRWEQKLGIAPNTLLSILLEGGDIERANRGEISGEEYCRRAAARVGTAEANLRALVEDAFAGDYVNQPLAAYIAGLRPGLQVAALTNTWSFGRSLIERHGIAGLFDLIVSSAEEGVCKPDERIYRITLERLGREPDEVVFVDDREDNVEAATRIGIHGVVHRTVEETTAALDALLPRERTGIR
jgi:putative hydrolase of the HAD superfamily